MGRHFRSSTLSGGRNRDSAMLTERKSALNVVTVQNKRKMLLKHDWETMIASSSGDVNSNLKRPLAVKIGIPP
jgi:hypothetical protein